MARLRGTPCRVAGRARTTPREQDHSRSEPHATAQDDPDREFPDAPRADYAPGGAGSDPGLFATLKRALKEFSEDNMTDWAASLTYYGVLSIFPALIAMVSIVGMFADPATDDEDDHRHRHPARARSRRPTRSPVRSSRSPRTAAPPGILLIVGIAGAIWSASGYVGAFSRAANVVWETPEGRPFWKLKPLQLLVTLAMILLSLVVVLSLILTGPVVERRRRPAGHRLDRAVASGTSPSGRCCW